QCINEVSFVCSICFASLFTICNSWHLAKDKLKMEHVFVSVRVCVCVCVCILFACCAMGIIPAFSGKKKKRMFLLSKQISSVCAAHAFDVCQRQAKVTGSSLS